MCEKPRYLHSQKTGFNSGAELTKFWNHVLSTKHSDTTMKFLRAALSIEFSATFEKHPNDFYSNTKRIRFNPYILLKAVLHDPLLNIAPLLAPDWFSDAFNALFAFQC